MKSLDLGYQKIDMCLNFYMLYYLENTKLTRCRTCEHSCYKPMTGRGRSLFAHEKFRYFSITHKLQKLLMSQKTIEHMTWHQWHDAMDGVMVHPFDSEAWKYFNNVHPWFLVETSNVCLGKLRYFSITPKLQRLLMSPKTIEHMTWHQWHDTVDGVMVHHFDSKTWKYFNNMHPWFLVETRNVCLGLFTDGFNSFKSFATPYSYWSVMLMVYNLPPEMCMKSEFMFLSMVILGSNSRGHNIDLYFWPLIDELK
jgi:hypothetical protein